MNRRFAVLMACGIACCSSVALYTRAEDPKKSQPDQAAMMKAWEEAATPGEEHKKLAEMAGEWTAKVEDFSSGTAMTSEGTAKFTMILGGRYLQQEFHGNMGGMEFEGIGMVGYNNMTKKFQETWIDAMGTAIYFAEGDRIDEHTTETKGKMSMPLVGPMNMRSVSKHIDKDHHEFEMYGPNPMDGKETLNIRITYTRKS